MLSSDVHQNETLAYYTIRLVSLGKKEKSIQIDAATKAKYPYCVSVHY